MVNLPNNLMTVEEGLFDPLLAKRSADDSSGSEQDSVWHESGGLDVEELKIGKTFFQKRYLLGIYQNSL